MNILSGENLILKVKDSFPSVNADRPDTALSKEQERELFNVRGHILDSRSSLIKGMKVLGDLIWCYEMNKNTLTKAASLYAVEVDSIAGIGLLIKEVAGIIDGLNVVEDDTVFVLQ